jgi:hypothetical protein
MNFWLTNSPSLLGDVVGYFVCAYSAENPDKDASNEDWNYAESNA